MQLTPLSVVRSRIKVGGSLPFNIRNADGTLLLARGKVIESEEQLEALNDRGAVVEGEDNSPTAMVRNARADRLPAMWSVCMSRVGRTLGNSTANDFTQALDEASKPILALIERDPDLAIFQMVQQDPSDRTNYGVKHSMHAALSGFLIARRLNWDAPCTMRAFKAGLTMNMGMLELQTRLANQVTPVTQVQRQQIRNHPLLTVEMLRNAGITDEEWITAIAQHHESPDGKGYPHGLNEVTELAMLLRFVDVYTAKLSKRATREALAGNEAARSMFMSDQSHPMVSAIVKEFGIYPPGCYVTLASGECGIVVKRGANANTPVVASLTSRNGDPLVEPIRRDTEVREHAIVGATTEKAIRVRVSSEKLVLLAHA
jgi:HD-GYP domain-containing protein (c-di-GMP phosphodiesterase class II)